MPRIKRQISYTKVYHIIMRGIDKQDLFLDENDYEKILRILKVTKEKYEYEIYAYCLMNNHIHLIIFDKNDNVSKIMQSIEISYSRYFNIKYQRVGHLFQNRFLSKKIEDRQYLKLACRYIHQNPVKAGIGTIERYNWSSYKEYLKGNLIINSKVILSLFSDDENDAVKEFVKFHNVQTSKEIFDLIEYEMKETLTDEQLVKYICEMLEIDNVYKLLQFNVQKRNEILVKIKENKKITCTQIARVLGISRKIIERAK